MNISPAEEIQKTLSPTDTGEASTHQAGLLVPKVTEILRFFPPLLPGVKNPRCSLRFIDTDGVTHWTFAFIYYNNKFFGGTRNEYRLTGMTSYLRAKALKAGDAIRFSKDREGRLFIAPVKATLAATDGDSLVLSPGWKMIKMKA